MARGIATESLEMFGIGRQVGNPGIHDSACAFHQFRQAAMTRFARSFEDKPQTFLDQVLELATTQRCLRLGPAVERAAPKCKQWKFFVWSVRKGWRSTLLFVPFCSRTPGPPPFSSMNPGAMGLFTLVGIAGEDDLDAPDLTEPPAETGKKVSSKTVGNGRPQTRSDGRAGRASEDNSGSTSRHAELSAALSASLRAELLRELEGLSSADGAALWAQQRLAAKKTLSAASTSSRHSNPS
jgi:hypothetical protein